MAEKMAGTKSLWEDDKLYVVKRGRRRKRGWPWRRTWTMEFLRIGESHDARAALDYAIAAKFRWDEVVVVDEVGGGVVRSIFHKSGDEIARLELP